MLHIIIKESKEFFREKINLVFMVLFPILLVFLLGNLLSMMDHAEEAIGKIKIQYLVETEDPYQSMVIGGFIDKITDHRNIIFEEASDLESAKQLASKDVIAAVVVFHGSPLKINIYEGTNYIKNRTVGMIMNGFIQTDKSVMTVIKTAPEALSDGINREGSFVKQKDLGMNRSMLDYYAITMLSMISVMSILQGSMAFLGERMNRTLNRLMIAPVSKIRLFFSKILGLFPQSILQLLILMIFSVFLFKAHYAANFLDNLYLFLMFFAVTLAATSIGAVFGIFIKGSPMVILMPVIWVMMFVSGTYSKEVYIKGLTEAMPIYQIQQAAFDITIFGRYQKAGAVILFSGIIIIVMLGAGAYIFSRKEEV